MNRQVQKLLIIVALLLGGEVIAQTNELGYSQELIWGIKKSTNGGRISGLIGKKGIAISPRVFRTYGIEIVNVKHPKESRFQTAFGSSYIFGKTNYLYAIRGQYGYDLVLFKKANQQGVQINAIAAGGPTIGVVAPYYVQVGDNFEPLDPRKQQDIQGSAGLLRGIGESKIQPGINFKGGLSFEFGTFKSSISGFELGFLVEAFPSKIVLIPAEGIKNRAVFTSVYVSVIYGSRK